MEDLKAMAYSDLKQAIVVAYRSFPVVPVASHDEFFALVNRLENEVRSREWAGRPRYGNQIISAGVE